MNRRNIVVPLVVLACYFSQASASVALQTTSSLSANPSSSQIPTSPTGGVLNGEMTIGNTIGNPPKQRKLLAAFRDRQSKIIEVVNMASPCVVALEGGTGVIVSADGLVLTASHVVKRAQRNMDVKLSNGVTWPAIALGCNEQTDTGMVKLIGYDAWPYVELFDGDQTEGQWVVGLGYPLSFARGAPAPIRVGRVLKRSGDRLVTDCLIMGGDSGGPLLDLEGRLIAISSRIKKGIHDNFHVHVRRYVKEWDSLLAGEVVDKTSKKGLPSVTGTSSESNDNRTTSSPAQRWGRSANELLPFWASVAEPVQATLIQIEVGQQPGPQQDQQLPATVCGTLVSLDGLAVAKRSLVLPWIKSGKLMVNYQDHQLFARPVGHDARNDLILLELNQKDRQGELVEFNAIQFPSSAQATNPRRLRSGSLLVSVSLNRIDPSVVSIKRATFLENRRREGIDFGMIVEGRRSLQLADENRKQFARDAIQVTRVYPDSLVAKSGIKVGDWIIQLGNRTVASQADLSNLSNQFAAGQRVSVLMMRDDELLTTNITIPKEGGRPTIFDRWGGGPFSEKRFGFVNIIAHDGVIPPEACGGPLVDLAGEVVGINISRATRVSTFAIPIEQVRRMVKRLRPFARMRIQSARNGNDES